MGFGHSQQREASAPQNTGSIYLSLKGERVIRILDQEETVYWRYYMPVPNVGGKLQDRSIVVGMDGPIKRYYAQFDDKDNRKRKPGKRMLLNVLDRTPVKKNSQGVAIYANENGVFPAVDPATSENISNNPIVPNNVVQIMDFGSDLMTKFATLHRRVRNAQTFEPLNIWDFDVHIISVPGKEPKDVQRNVIPGMDQAPLGEEFSGVLKYDLTKIVHIMPDEAQQAVLDGKDLLEILKELNWARPVPTLPLSAGIA